MKWCLLERLLLTINYPPWVWAAIIALATFAYFLFMLPTDITWVNVGSDGPDYILGMKYLRVSHPTGQPLYTLMGAAWMRMIPWGTEWFRIALMSAVFSAATAGILYRMTRSFIAPLIFVSSGVVVSQSILVELYAPVTFFIVLAWWLHSTEHRGWGYAVVGLGLAVHHLAGFMWLGLLAKDYYEKNGILPGLWAIASGLPWYAYIVLANRAPFISVGGTGVGDYLNFFGAQTFLLGGLAIFGNDYGLTGDFKERLWDVFRLIFMLGPALIPLMIAIKAGFATKATLLPSLILLILLYYATDLDARVYTYTMVSVALVAILVAQQPLSRIMKGSIIAFSVLMIGINLSYDLNFAHKNRVSDPYASAVQFRHALSALPPNAIVWSHNRGWEKMTTVLYNFDHGTNIDTISVAWKQQAPESTYTALKLAEAERRLWHTYIVDGAHYFVQLERITADEVMRDVAKLDLVDGKKWLEVLE